MTKCLNCGMVLTTAAGVREHCANFDSSLPCGYAARLDGLGGDAVTWARCDACYRQACNGQAAEAERTKARARSASVASATFGPPSVKWDESGDIANGYAEEPQLVAEIKRVLLTFDQKRILATLDLTIEDCLNGRYDEVEERYVEAVLYADWNARIGRKVFGSE